MKCPVCGTENKSTDKACYRCTHVFDDGAVRTKGNVNTLWYGKSERKADANTPPPFWGDAKGKPVYDDKTDFIVLHDEASDENAAQDLVDRGAPVPDNRKKIGRLESGREVQVVVPARPRARVEQAARGRRVRIRWPRLILSTAVILVLCTGLGFGVYMAYKAAVGSISEYFAGRNQNDETKVPRVRKVMIDGNTWHEITFYGKEGEMVLVKDPKRSIPIQNGEAKLLLDDQSYIPEGLTEEKVIVSLEAVIISPDKPERAVTIEPYEISVPLAPVKLVLPQEQAVTTNANSIFVKIKVTPGCESVYIGDVNVTDNVNSEGYASATIDDLEPNSVNTIRVIVKLAKHRDNVMELRVERPVMAVPVHLDDDIEDETKESSIVVSGSTEAGAQITTDAKVKGDITVGTDGQFRFTAELKRWGWNDISITSTAADGRKATLTHRVNHTPTLEGYSKKAWPFGEDYDYLCASAENMIGTVYVLKGMIVEKLENDTSDYYLFNAGPPGQMKLVVVEYGKEEGLKPDQYYSLYADVSGVLENYPVLTVRYLYALDTPAGYGTAKPAGSATPGASATPEASASPAAGGN